MKKQVSVRILRLEHVKEKTGFSKAMILRMEADGKFPRRRKIGQRAVGWLEHEVSEFILSRPTVILK